MSDIDHFLTVSGAPAFKFETPGDTVKGTVTNAETRDVLKFGTQELDTWPNGNKKEQLVVTLDTGDGEFRVFAVKPSAMFAAIVEAVAGRSFQVGGTLAVKFTGTRPSEKYGTPQKLYAAAYEPPAVDLDAKPSVDDF